MSEQAFRVRFEALLSDDLPDDDIADLLVALADEEVTTDRLVYAAGWLRSRAVPLRAPEDAIDVCGTGGDSAGTLNVSTAVALLVASCGVPVAKHGNRGATSRSGASDVLHALGIRTDLPPDQAESQLRQVGIAFLSAPQYHPVLARLAPVRRRIGRRTIFNLLGPLLSPARVTRQLVGVFAEDKVEVMAQALARLGAEHAWVVSGGGLDELSVAGTNMVGVVRRGTVALQKLEPAEFGVVPCMPEDLAGASPEANAVSLLRLFEGERGAYRDVVLLNTAAALVVAGRASTIEATLPLAVAALDDGRALTLLRRLQHDSSI